eukprot:g2700.t1
MAKTLDQLLHEAAAALYNAPFPAPYQLIVNKKTKKRPEVPFQLTCHLPSSIAAGIAKGSIAPPAARAGDNPKEISQALWDYVTARKDELLVPIRDHNIDPKQNFAIKVNLVPTADPLPPLPAAAPGIDENQLNHPYYHNWIRVGLALRETMKGLGPFVQRHAEALHNDILALGLPCPDPAKTDSRYRGKLNKTFAKELEGVRENLDEAEEHWAAGGNAAGTPEEEKVELRRKEVSQMEAVLDRNKTLDPWASAILDRHGRKQEAKVTWTNSDAGKWAAKNGHWQLVKCYCSSLGSHEECITQQLNANTVDATALLNMMLLCDEFAGKSVDAVVVKAALRVRNGHLFHNSHFHLTDDQASDAFGALTALLKDPAELLADPRAQQAVKTIEDDIRVKDFSFVPFSAADHTKMVADHAKAKVELDRAQVMLQKQQQDADAARERLVEAELALAESDAGLKKIVRYGEQLQARFEAERSKKRRAKEFKTAQRQHDAEMGQPHQSYASQTASSMYSGKEDNIAKEKEKIAVQTEDKDDAPGQRYFAVKRPKSRRSAKKGTSTEGLRTNSAGRRTEMSQTMQEEAQIILQVLPHENVLDLVDIAHVFGVPVLVMPWGDGGSLDKFLRAFGKDLTAPQLVGLCIQLCRGLGHLHDSGVVHYDLKPANVIVFTSASEHNVSNGIVLKVADFGCVFTV